MSSHYHRNIPPSSGFRDDHSRMLPFNLNMPALQITDNGRSNGFQREHFTSGDCVSTTSSDKIHSQPIPLSLESITATENPYHVRLNELRLASVPPHPTLSAKQGRDIKPHIAMLHCDKAQLAAINSIYEQKQFFHEIFRPDEALQAGARRILLEQGLDIHRLNDLGNGWSIRWSKDNNYGKDDNGLDHNRRLLLQCQRGSSSSARQAKDNSRRLSHNKQIFENEWTRKMPYDFTACLAHIDLTFQPNTYIIQRITGITEHNEKCRSEVMKRLPAVPLHPHVWQIALDQLNKGASLSVIQETNRDLLRAGMYHEQKFYDPKTANIRYNFLPSDTCRLYRKQATSNGINLLERPELNVDNWLNPDSPEYNKTLASVIFGYRGRYYKEERFRICIQTPEMRTAAWKYAHHNQIILDGTFGLCDRRLLLFIAMAIDEQRKGLPIAFFLFSAPTGTRATHAGYDTVILTELLREWKHSMGRWKDEAFTPKVAITDTDLKERGALLSVWPSICLLLCKFHLRQCWTNKRNSLLPCMKSYNFDKMQIQIRLRALEEALLITTTHGAATMLIQSERTTLHLMSEGEGSNPAAKSGLLFLDYLDSTWMPLSLWSSWSQYGRIRASEVLNISLDGVLPTTNHLEAFNGILKNKYIKASKHGHQRVRFDVLIFLLGTRVLPEVYKQRKVHQDYTNWLSDRFRMQAGGVTLTRNTKRASNTNSLTNDISSSPPLAWWDTKAKVKLQEEIKQIISRSRIKLLGWTEPPYTLHGTCASTHADIRQPNHPYYEVRISCYGWATCTCKFFLGGKGCCKHLWAFRKVLETFRIQYHIIYPETYNDAEKIFSALQPYSTLTTNTAISQLPPPPIDSLATLSIEVATTLAETTSIVTNTEDEDNVNETTDTHSESYSDSDDGMKTLDHQGLRYQGSVRLEHELSHTLPRLHGLSILIKDAADYEISTASQHQLSELVQVISEIQLSCNSLLESASSSQPGNTASSIYSGIHNNRSSGLSTFNIGSASSSFSTVQQTLRPELIPPSPEPNQKRKRSYATS